MDAMRQSSIDRVLRWGVVVTLIAAIAVMAYGTAAVYQAAPPIPDRIVGPGGAVVYTGADIVAGKGIFQRTDLMDFGSLYGNGAYFGPDWGSDYLYRQGRAMRDTLARSHYGLPYSGLDPLQRESVDRQTVSDLTANRFSDGTLTLTAAQVAAHRALAEHYRQLFTAGDRPSGLQAQVVRTPREAAELTAFFGWVAWTSVARRPGAAYSYTNNWPYEPSVGNEPTPAMYTWTWWSLGVMVLLAAVVYLFYRRYIAGDHVRVDPAVAAQEFPLTSSQRSTALWFALVPLLMLLQAGVGVLLAHYYADRAGFYGLDLRSILPFNVLKAWHLQLAIAWVAAAWMGAGLFLAPQVGQREPKHQRTLSVVLWATVVLVVVGALVGMYLGLRAEMGPNWFWFGNQGLEYIQLGRVFQIALFAGLLIWAVLLLRAFWPGLRARRSWGSLEHLLLYSGAAIGGVYLFGMIPMTQIMASATLTDFWRWWVVHLWVENVFEFFTVAVTGYALLSMGLLSRRMVERTVYFELILIFGTGIIGTGHHFYWAGEPAVWMGLGSMFSMLEVIPLGVMLALAWREYRAINAAGRDFPQRVAFYYFTGAAVWNLIGAGVLGGVINPPIVNYFEHGTFLTLAHGHASMMGVFGLLALGLLYFSMRGMTAAGRWSATLPLWALRLFHASIALWLVGNLIPLGIAQLLAVTQSGFWFSRSLDFYQRWTMLQWLRLPGDAAFLLAGLLVLVDLIGKLRRRREATVREGRLLRPVHGAPL